MKGLNIFLFWGGEGAMRAKQSRPLEAKWRCREFFLCYCFRNGRLAGLGDFGMEGRRRGGIRKKPTFCFCFHLKAIGQSFCEGVMYIFYFYLRRELLAGVITSLPLEITSTE